MVVSHVHEFVFYKKGAMHLPKDTAQDRGLNVCTEKRDAVLSALEDGEAGKLMQDEDIAVSGG